MITRCALVGRFPFTFVVADVYFAAASALIARVAPFALFWLDVFVWLVHCVGVPHVAVNRKVTVLRKVGVQRRVVVGIDLVAVGIDLAVVVRVDRRNPSIWKWVALADAP